MSESLQLKLNSTICAVKRQMNNASRCIRGLKNLSEVHYLSYSVHWDPIILYSTSESKVVVAHIKYGDKWVFCIPSSIDNTEL
jgi:hypothetical protein